MTQAFHDICLCLFVYHNKPVSLILHFTVVCLVGKPLNRREAKVYLVMLQTLDFGSPHLHVSGGFEDRGITQ